MLQAISEHLRRRPELLPQTLSTLFEIVLFEDCSNQWSLSRPMLSLILLNEQIYHELKHRIVASQPVRAAGLVLSLEIHDHTNDMQAVLVDGHMLAKTVCGGDIANTCGHINDMQAVLGNGHMSGEIMYV